MKFSEYKYERPNLEEINKQFTDLFKKLENAKTKEETFELIEKTNRLSEKITAMIEICAIRNSIDTTNEFYEKEQEFLDENVPKLEVYVTQYAKILLQSKFRKEIDEKYGKAWLELKEMNIKSFDEIIIPELQEEAKLQTKYSKLLASAKIEFDGKINNLTQMAAYAENKDRSIRKAAYLKKAEFMVSIEDQIDEIYDQLVKVRDTMAKKMGYDNYVDFGYLRLKRSDYNSKDAEKYRDQVYREIVPIVNKLRQEQATRLDIEILKEYDVNMFYKDVNPRPIGSTNELVEKAYKMYSSISKETEEFFRYMKENELLDLETKPGKQGGGYCAFIPMYNSPFIFSNFNKTSGDVDVLTHEAGHAFQVFTSSKFLNTYDLVWATLEACEIDSMSMEFFAHPYMDSFFGNQADKYRFMHLADSISFIPYGVSIDEFQHFVYENPDCGIKARKDKWREIEKKYTPWRDYDGVKYYENGAYWQRQSHLFHTAFYYIDYTLAQVCAFYFYLSDLKDHETAWNKYYELCKLGGSKSFLNLLKTVGIPNPFIEGTLKSIMEPLIKRLEELKEKI